MYEWVKGNAYHLIATLYDGNITLNSAAASYFSSVRWVMIGINRSENKIAIKPVSKNEIDLKLVPMAHLHKISVGKGYGRISNKLIMQEIKSMLGRDLNGVKVGAMYDEEENLLEIDLMEIIE